MIRELRIRNLALIEDVHVEFSKGLSVFTGETGAGKSILVGAIGLLLGERASSEQVRGGFDEAEVNGVFELGEMSRSLADLFDAGGIPREGGECIVRRVISRSGKNRVFVNQVPLPLSRLKSLGDRLVDFHGQHEHQSLLAPETARLTVDGLPGVVPAAAEYRDRYGTYAAAVETLAAHDRHSADLAARREVMEFAYNELKSLGLAPGEEARLERELTLLSSSAQRLDAVAKIDEILSGDETGLVRQMAAVRKHIETLARYDATALPWLDDLRAPAAVFSALESYCGAYLDKAGDAVEPGRLDDINARLAKIQRLKKKHGCDFEGLVAREKQLAADLAALAGAGANREDLAKVQKAALDACVKAGKALSSARKKRAEDFDAAVTAQMAKLGFFGGKLETVFTPFDVPQPAGLEDAQFLVRTNPGEALLPLVKIASGGEISRLMLAIKTVLASHDNVPILVFDEIDSGIGGVLAVEVAKALVALGATHQVLCISHLHQIAAVADRQYHVFKGAQSGRTVTLVKLLGKEERVTEIARMLGGDSAIARKHAEELLTRKKG